MKKISLSCLLIAIITCLSIYLRKLHIDNKYYTHPIIEIQITNDYSISTRSDYFSHNISTTARRPDFEKRVSDILDKYQDNIGDFPIPESKFRTCQFNLSDKERRLSLLIPFHYLGQAPLFLNPSIKHKNLVACANECFALIEMELNLSKERLLEATFTSPHKSLMSRKIETFSQSIANIRDFLKSDPDFHQEHFHIVAQPLWIYPEERAFRFSNFLNDRYRISFSEKFIDVFKLLNEKGSEELIAQIPCTGNYDFLFNQQEIQNHFPILKGKHIACIYFSEEGSVIFSTSDSRDPASQDLKFYKLTSLSASEIIEDVAPEEKALFPPYLTPLPRCTKPSSTSKKEEASSDPEYSP